MAFSIYIFRVLNTYRESGDASARKDSGKKGADQ
jgi:hypothetical protein